jgi:hypothetical protein
MAIAPKTGIIDIPILGGLIAAGSTQFHMGGVFADESFSNLYFRVVGNNNTFYAKKVNITDPANPVITDWTLTNTTVANSASMGNNMCYDMVGGYAYQVSGVSQSHLVRINLSSGQVEFGPRFDTNLIALNEIWGVFKDGDVLYIHGKATIDQSVRFVVFKYDMSGPFTWYSAPTSAAATFPLISRATTTAGAAANLDSHGMVRAADGHLLVFRRTLSTVEKYSKDDLSLIGAAEWTKQGGNSTSSYYTDVSHFTRGGYIYSLSFNFNSLNAQSNVTVYKYLDESTGTVSSSRSRLLIDDRLVKVGEDDVVTMQFQLKDEFGASATALQGLPCRFAIMTNRGTLDGDDAALSASPNGPWRGAGNVPLTRQVDVTVGPNGEATCYFQSARESTADSVYDVVKVSYPPA